MDIDMNPGHATSYGYDQPPTGNPPPPQYIVQQPQPMGTLRHTTVIVQPQEVEVELPKNFSSGICGCFDDMEICCLGFWVPCILGCQMSTAMNESCCVPNCLPGGTFGMRIKARMQYNIGGSICNDWCSNACCAYCVLCQLARELRSKGAM